MSSEQKGQAKNMALAAHLACRYHPDRLLRRDGVSSALVCAECRREAVRKFMQARAAEWNSPTLADAMGIQTERHNDVRRNVRRG